MKLKHIKLEVICINFVDKNNKIVYNYTKASGTQLNSYNVIEISFYIYKVVVDKSTSTTTTFFIKKEINLCKIKNL